MTKQEILATFSDINFAYNDSSKYETLSRMLDELLKEQNSCENCAIAIEDRQPVVRCIDCKHSKHWYRDKALCYLWDESGVDVFEDGFCNYGALRGEQDD